MLETYFVKPETAGRIRACWIGTEIECYAGWLSEQGYSTRTVLRHIQALVAFGEFARRRGASALADLPAHVDSFVAMRVASSRRGRDAATEVRGPVEQMLAVILPGFGHTGRSRRELPFSRAVPGFFEYLAAERGLRPESIAGYRHHLTCFEAYLGQIGVTGLQELSPAILSAFVAERAGAGLARTTVRTGCGMLRVFLRYAHRQGLLATDLSKAVEWPTAYRLADIPRSISREEAGLVLGAVDRRTASGKTAWSRTGRGSPAWSGSRPPAAPAQGRPMLRRRCSPSTGEDPSIPAPPARPSTTWWPPSACRSRPGSRRHGCMI